MKLFRLILSAAIAIFVSYIQLNAYPIDPCPLRELCIQSDLIVVAKVGPTVEKQLRCWDNTKIELEVLSVLKGNLTTDKIYCFYNSDEGSCPEPPYYPQGNIVLAFLDRRLTPESLYLGSGEIIGCYPKDYDNGISYITHAESYGTKDLCPYELHIYLKKIHEFLNISKISNEIHREILTLDWLQVIFPRFNGQ